MDGGDGYDDDKWRDEPWNCMLCLSGGGGLTFERLKRKENTSGRKPGETRPRPLTNVVAPAAAWAVLHVVVLAVAYSYPGTDLSRAAAGESGHVAGAVFFYLCLAATAALYAATAGSDPGFVDPKECPATEVELTVSMNPSDEDTSSSDEEGGLLEAAGSADVEAAPAGVAMAGAAAQRRQRRTCPYCRCAQALRTKHCHDCDRCVRRFDHHCPWMGTCIGERNHCRFLWFCAMQLLCAGWAHGVLSSGYKSFDTARQWLDYNGGLLAAQLVTGPAVLFLGSLVALHCFLVASNQTTWELSKGRAISYLRGVPGNVQPFSRGVAANTREFCCGPVPAEYSMPSQQELDELSVKETFWENRYYSCC